jgi:hypothetical protein
MKPNIDDIKREILKTNLMIRKIYKGDNSVNSKILKKRLEAELDGLLYQYFKYRIHRKGKDDN